MDDITQDDFIALLTYRTASEGGRSTPARTGYRPGVKFPFSHMQTSGRQTFLDREWVNPGDTVKTAIKIVSVEFFKHSLGEGMAFEFCEGSNIMGTGVILEILNPLLKK